MQVIVYTVAALSIERYIDARSTFTAKFRRLITFISLILIWTLGLLLPIPFMFFTYLEVTNTSNNSKHTGKMRSCQSHLSENELLIHEMVLYIIAFLIPYAIIVVFSLKLLKFLRDWLKRKEQLTRTSVSKKRTRGVKLVLCIVLSFLICYTPFWAFKFYTRLADDSTSPKSLLRRVLYYIHLLVVLLNHFEGLLNPLFFIVLTERFCLTFSKHRQRHSRLFGLNPPILLSSRDKKPKKTTSMTSITMKNTEINGLLTINNHHTDEIPVAVQTL